MDLATAETYRSFRETLRASSYESIMGNGDEGWRPHGRWKGIALRASPPSHLQLMIGVSFITLYVL